MQRAVPRPAGAHTGSQPEGARGRAQAFALWSSLASLSACTLLIGEAPEVPRDAGGDAAEHDAEPPDPEIDAGDTQDTGPAREEAGQDAARTDADVDADARDAGSVDADPPDCSGGPLIWYPDDDDDGYGRTIDSVQTCPKPSGVWVRSGGDCDDGRRDVNPGETRYFEVPYTAAGGNLSFDYDCSGNEEGNPMLRRLESSCDGVLDVLACSDMGYMRTQRIGPGIDGFCGSQQSASCVSNAPLNLGCTTSPPRQEATPYSCR